MMYLGFWAVLVFIKLKGFVSLRGMQKTNQVNIDISPNVAAESNKRMCDCKRFLKKSKSVAT